MKDVARIEIHSILKPIRKTIHKLQLLCIHTWHIVSNVREIPMNNNVTCHICFFYKETEYLFDRTFSCQVALKEVVFKMRKTQKIK